MRNSNLFHKITGTSYETGLFDLQIIQMIHNGDRARLPSFPSVRTRATSARVQVRVCVCVFVCCRSQRLVNDSLSVKDMSLSGWCLCELWPGAGSHHERGADTRTGNITLWFPTRGETLLSQSAMPLFRPHFEVIPIDTCVSAEHSWQWHERCLSLNLFFLQELLLKKKHVGFIFFCSQSLDETGCGKPLPSLSLTLWLFLCNNNTRVLVQCPAVYLLGRW